MNNLRKSKEVQQIARETMDGLKAYIEPGVSEVDIAAFAEAFMRRRGINKFWYHNIAALVLVGVRTPLSLSGRTYRPAETKVVAGDLVTVDLSPEENGAWGDYARSFVANADQTHLDSYPISGELRSGLEAEVLLHQKLRNVARPDLTFEDIYLTMNEAIDGMGYINLDFHGNLGHSIEEHLDNRRYIEKGCSVRLDEVKMFTFEPHIKSKEGAAGFKRENIYYFENGELTEL